ncbi:MAG: hypothetical protein HRT35_38090, partial [Algicola sp.]|nr:hypothetical protein [Algicola sp.]
PAMSEINPIVQSTVKGTLTEIINSLEYITKSLTDPERQMGEPMAMDEPAKLTANELAGLCNIVECAKAATESCYAQYCTEMQGND